jgi:hypothetical protein
MMQKTHDVLFVILNDGTHSYDYYDVVHDDVMLYSPMIPISLTRMRRLHRRRKEEQWTKKTTVALRLI